MTLEELQALVAELTASVDSLKTKNATLISEKRVLQAKAKGADIDPEEHAALQSQVENLSDQVKTLTKSKDTETGALKKSLAEKDTALSGLLIDSGITEALAKGGVAPHYLPTLKSHLKSQAQIKSENGAFSAVLGEKPLAEGVAAFLASEDGKHFIGAPASSGGGASGGGKSGSGGAEKRSAMSIGQKTAYISEHGQDAYLKLPD